jgi:Ala-tRNA(Pro) deacylase
MKLDEFLSSRQIPFERMEHRPTFTANRMAQALHVPGREVAKSVLLRTSRGHYVLAVVPAPYRVDLEQLCQCLGEADLELASEREMEQVFPDCECGAMPPFGSLYQVPTVVDDNLAQDDEIVFDAQNHHEAIRMSYSDYEALEHPRRGHFVRH